MKSLLLLMMSCFVTAAALGGLVLPGASPGDDRIVIPGNPSVMEKIAADELALYLGRVFAAEFTVAKEGDDGSGLIYLGNTEFAAGHGVDFAAFANEEWLIRSTADGRLILGGSNRGVMYAAYQFLEKHLGVRWFDEFNERVPKLETVSFDELNERGRPGFTIRQIYDNLDWQTETQLLKRRNKLHGCTNAADAATGAGAARGDAPLVGSPDQYHTYGAYIREFDPAKTEALALGADGKRHSGQICLTNPEARKMTAAALRKFIAADRAAAVAGNYLPPVIYDISANDNNSPCQCPDCVKLEAEEGASGVAIDFLNAAARDIAADYPDIRLRTFAYMFSSVPPKTIKPEANVIIQIAQLGLEFGAGEERRDTASPITAATNTGSLRLLEAWCKIAPNIEMWDYWVMYDGNMLTPLVCLEKIASDIVTYKQYGIEYLFAECEYPHTAAFFALKRYLGMKMMDNPEADAAAIIDDFMDGMYGAAAPAMREYLQYLTKRQGELKEAPGKLKPIHRSYLDAAFFRTTFRLFAEAEAQAAGDARILANIRNEKVPVEYAFALNYQKLKWEPGETPVDFATALANFERDALDTVRHYYIDHVYDFKSLFSGQVREVISTLEKSARPQPVPEQFKDRNAVILYPHQFRENVPVVKIEEPGAFNGQAVKYGQNEPGTLHKTTTEGVTLFAVYDANTGGNLVFSPINSKDLPQDEKYHVYHLGEVTLRDGSAYFYGATGWEFQCGFEPLYDPNAGAEGNRYDIYMSAKFTGPDYVQGSTAENAICIDYLAAVKK